MDCYGISGQNVLECSLVVVRGSVQESGPSISFSRLLCGRQGGVNNDKVAGSWDWAPCARGQAQSLACGERPAEAWPPGWSTRTLPAVWA